MKFLMYKAALNQTVKQVHADIKMKMGKDEIGKFVENAGFIIWDKARVYPASGFKTTVDNEEPADSIVVLPVAQENTNQINAALVAKMYYGGDSIVYSTHFKNDFSRIDSTAQTDYGIRANALYILGMAQLDAETFNHKQFIIKNLEPELGLNSVEAGTGINTATIRLIELQCEYSFSYSSALVYPPVVIYSYTATCGSAIALPPAAFLQALDESYGMVLFSNTPIAEGGGGSVSPYGLLFSNFYQSLDPAYKAFLDNVENTEFYHGFVDYLILHQYSQEAKDHITWCIFYLLENTTLMPTFSDFYAEYLSDFPSLSFLTQPEIDFMNQYPLLKARLYHYLETFQLNLHQKAEYHVNKLQTDLFYLSYNIAYVQDTANKSLWFSDANYLQDYGGTPWGEWAINYLMEHPGVDFEVFFNQYLTQPYQSNYQLTQHEQDVFDQLDAEDNLADQNHLNLDCQGTKRTGNIFFNGTKEHWMIQLDYVSKNPLYGDVEFAIPFSSPAGNRGYADVVNLQDKTIFEIKPDNANGWASGASEVANYVQKANMYCGVTLPMGVPWNTGVNYTSTTIPTSTPNKYLQTRLHAPGVIVYSTNINSNPIPMPVAVPASIVDKFKHLIDRLKHNFEQADRIIAEYLQQNPDLATYVKTAAIGAGVAIIVGTILEDVVTAGAGIADDWACFVLAYRIIRFAVAL